MLAEDVCGVSSFSVLVVLVTVVWAQAAAISTMKMAENVIIGFILMFETSDILVKPGKSAIKQKILNVALNTENYSV